MGRDAWARLGRGAAGRFGVFTSAEALKAGVSRMELSRSCDAGTVERLRRAVYRFVAAPLTPKANVLAAVLAGGPTCVASHTTAAALWGLADLEVVEPCHLLSDRPTQRRVEVATIHVSRTVTRLDVTRLGAIPLTTPWRTTVDACGILACGCDEVEAAEDLVIEAFRRGLAKEHQLRDVVERMGPAPGTAVVRAALTSMDPDEVRRLLSWLEQYFLRLIAKAGLPQPEVNVRLHGRNGELIAKVDFIWSWARLVVEIDGLRWHSLPSQKLYDDDRQNKIVLAGERILRFGAKKLREAPDDVIEVVAEALAATRGG
ncbi:MAG: type IV toxin-antitoxin system AbiEi family antitoxin domain-containing protein [Nitriliruptorales bacterium]